MNSHNEAKPKDIVLVGAGHAHVEVIRSFGLKPLPGSRLTLITRQAHTPYSGMLPGLIAGLYAFEDTHIDVRPLCKFAGARLVLNEAVGIDFAVKRVICAGGPLIPFDILSIDIGSTPNTCDVPGAAQHAVAVKPIDGFLSRFEAARQRILAKRGIARVCIVGAGAGGVELMLSMERRLRRDIRAAGYDPGGASFFLLSADPEILAAFPSRMRSRVREILAARGIKVITGMAATRVDNGRVYVTGGEPLSADEVFWATQASAVPWLSRTGLKLDAQGFIEVEATLESTSHRSVFAAGDVASLRGHRLPKAGVYAVREGPVLADNLRRAVLRQPPQAYEPQRHILSLISTGERYAIGTRNGLTFEGAWVWRWKDWIDRRFMRKFKRMPLRVSTR